MTVIVIRIVQKIRGRTGGVQVLNGLATLRWKVVADINNECQESALFPATKHHEIQRDAIAGKSGRRVCTWQVPARPAETARMMMLWLVSSRTTPSYQKGKLMAS